MLMHQTNRSKSYFLALKSSKRMNSLTYFISAITSSAIARRKIPLRPLTRLPRFCLSRSVLSGACALVDLEFPGYDDVFTEDRTSHHLSCYEGLVTVTGRDVEIRALAWHEQDVMALEVTERRLARLDALIEVRANQVRMRERTTPAPR